jgi:phosphohistidine phosphatase
MLDSRPSEIDAMRLMILRHAKAEKSAPGMRDRDRPLNPRGHKDAARMGAYMAHHRLLPDRALVSTARRTGETWDGLAFPADIPVNYEDRLYENTPQAILAMLQEVGPPARSLLVVGHNPGLHEVARLLIASGDVVARERLNEGFPSASLAVIDFAGGDWVKLHAHSGRLERFVTPHMIRVPTD